MIESIAKILSALKPSKETIVIVSLAAVMATGILLSAGEQLGISDFVKARNHEIILIAIVAVAILTALGLTKAVDLAGRGVRAHRRKKKIRRNICELTIDEKIFLRALLSDNQQHTSVAMFDPLANLLLSKSILVRTSPVGNEFEWPVAVHNEVWDLLREEPSILGEKGTERAEPF